MAIPNRKSVGYEEFLVGEPWQASPTVLGLLSREYLVAVVPFQGSSGAMP